MEVVVEEEDLFAGLDTTAVYVHCARTRLFSLSKDWHSSHGRRLRVTVVTLDLVTPTRKGEPRLLLQLRCSLRQIVLGKIGLTHVTRLVTVS